MNKFISETEVEEKRRKRQEEWEKVRKPDDPKEAPEETYDPRSLYERLQEQKDKKQEEFEEALKFKNQFRGVDRDEVEFLDHVAARASQLEKEKNDVIQKELKAFKQAQITLIAEKKETKASEKSQNVTKEKRQNLQSNIVRKAVKRKSDSKPVPSTTETPDTAKDRGSSAVATETVVVYPSVAKCVGILPGMSSYDDDTNSTSSSSDSDDCSISS